MPLRKIIDGKLVELIDAKDESFPCRTCVFNGSEEEGCLTKDNTCVRDGNYHKSWQLVKYNPEEQ